MGARNFSKLKYNIFRFGGYNSLPSPLYTRKCVEWSVMKMETKQNAKMKKRRNKNQTDAKGKEEKLRNKFRLKCVSKFMAIISQPKNATKSLMSFMIAGYIVS